MSKGNGHIFTGTCLLNENYPLNNIISHFKSPILLDLVFSNIHTQAPAQLTNIRVHTVLLVS